MTADVILSFFFTSLVLTIAPGPDVMYVLSQSISRGYRFGLAAAIGLSAGLMFHTTLLAFGISGIITSTPWLFKGIKIFGALYLLWIAYNILRSDAVFRLQEKESHADKPWKNIFQGLVMNILNPKVMLFFLALFPTFIHHEQGNIKVQVYALGVIFLVQAFLVFSIYAVLASTLTKFLRESRSFNLFLKWLQILVFVALAVFMLL